MAGPYDKYIYCREDPLIKGVSLADGESVYTDPFVLYRDCLFGVLGLYIYGSGGGTLDISYQVDPGEEGGEMNDRAHEWFTPTYRNPVETGVPAGNIVIPVEAVVGRFLRFKLQASGSVDITKVKLVIQ